MHTHARTIVSNFSSKQLGLIHAARRQSQRYFLLEDFLLDDFLRGTFAPDRRASDKPIAIACLRLFTFLPERPLFNVPALRSCIACFTFSPAFLPYLAIR